MNFIIKYLLTALAVYATADLLSPHIIVGSFWSAIVVALVLGLINVTVKPIMILFTIPFTIFSLGLFLLVINALMILLADWLITGFQVEGFWWALAFSIIVSAISWVLEKLVLSEKKEQ